MDQGSNKNHSPAYNFTPTVTKFCVMWEGLSLPHDTKFGNCRCKIVDSRSFHSWSLIHGLRWSGLIKVGPGWWLLSQFSPFPYFSDFSELLSNHTLAIGCHLFIWHVSPQLSCQLWKWLNQSNRYFFKIENIAYGEINEMRFSNPHPSCIVLSFIPD